MKHIPSLNGFRAISVLLVISQHLSTKNQIFKGLYNLNWPILELPLKLIRDGQLGVNVFFIISGYLITRLLITEESQNGKISLKNFYIRRSLRIFPPFYFLLFCYFVFQSFGLIDISKTAWVSSLTYTKYLFISGDWFTAHFWSLSIEEHFYLVWPFLFLLFKKQRSFLAVLIIGIPFLGRFFEHSQLDENMFHSLSIFSRMDSLGIGCLLALHYQKAMNWIERNKSWVLITAITVILFTEYLTLVPASGKVALLFQVSGLQLGPVNSIAIAIILLFFTSPRTTWFYRFLNHKTMVWIGSISYSLYLWQQFFISGSGHWYTDFPANLLLVFIASSVSFYLIEKPSLKLKHRFNKA